MDRKKPNGCGPWWLGDHDWLDGPDGRFETPCMRHDHDYQAGGSELDRWRADWRLYRATLAAASRLPLIKRWAGYLWATGYLVLVLLMGWTTYTYKRT